MLVVKRPTWEATPPPGLQQASWRDAPRLWQISMAGLRRIFRQHKLLLILCGVYLSLGVIALVLGLIVGGVAGWSLMLMWCIAVGLFAISTLAVTFGAVAFRLADPRRFVALSDDRGVVLDVVTLTRKKHRLVRLETTRDCPRRSPRRPSDRR